MKKSGKWLAVLAVSLFTLSFAVSAMAADTIKVGVAGSHSGDLASYGLPTVNAAKLVVKKINASGGVLGKQVELLVEDDVCKPEVRWCSCGHRSYLQRSYQIRSWYLQKFQYYYHITLCYQPRSDIER